MPATTTATVLQDAVTVELITLMKAAQGAVVRQQRLQQEAAAGAPSEDLAAVRAQVLGARRAAADAHKALKEARAEVEGLLGQVQVRTA